MAKSDFVPSRDNDLAAWTQNLQTKIGNYTTELGLTAADVTVIGGYCQAIREAVSDHVAIQQTARNIRQQKEAAVSENVKKLRHLIRQWKAGSHYSDAIGADIGVIGSEQAEADETYKPSLKAQSLPGHVTLTFSKKGGIEGVNIYGRLQGQAAWVKLSFDSHSPYIDNRPLAAGAAEHREYMCLGVIADEETGQPSDIVSVVFGG